MWQDANTRCEKVRVRAGIVGINTPVSNASTIVRSSKINGSGSKHFGGANSWPYVGLTVEFPAGEQKKRDKLARLLEKTVEEFMNKS